MEHIEYVSGRGRASTTPEEIKKWNWGAFFLHGSGAWGIIHS